MPRHIRMAAPSNPGNVSWINEPPIADAGTDQAIKERETVTLDGSGSKDVDDGIASCQWSQNSGPSVSLSSPAVYQPTFTARSVRKVFI
ncbi:MAG: PKD domain-containing protein [Nitrospinales bacterium]